MSAAEPRPIEELVGLRVPACLALAKALEEDLDPAAFGHRQLAALTDPLLIAIASDEAVQAARTVRTNLVEMRLHESAASKALTESRRGPRRDSEFMETASIARAEAELHLAGFFRAAGSVFDCLAAVAIVVLQAPLRVRRADANDLGSFGEGKKRRAKATETQLAAWDAFDALVRAQRDGMPKGWYDWTMATRNAVVHRGRKLRLFSQVPKTGTKQLLVATDDQIGTMMQLAEFELHLPRNPEAADMSDLAIGASVTTCPGNSRV